MIKYVAFIGILALRIAFHPLTETKEDNAPFASPSPLPAVTTAATSATLISIEGTIQRNKVILNWVVDENESADLFEVEKSTDGRNYSMAALVFGTDLPETGKYQFYEKAGNQKTRYRIKLVNKDRKTIYSDVIEINPKA